MKEKKHILYTDINFFLSCLTCSGSKENCLICTGSFRNIVTPFCDCINGYYETGKRDCDSIYIENYNNN